MTETNSMTEMHLKNVVIFPINFKFCSVKKDYKHIQ